MLADPHAPIPIAVHVPGRITRRRDDGGVEREPGYAAGLMLTQDEAARVLQLDVHASSELGVYQTLYRHRRAGRLRAVRRGKRLLYPTEEIVRCSRLMVEHEPRAASRRRRPA
ncbi:MAG: helix-turn-helix domain-containing protein [Planctomycetota bacterium]